MQGRLISEKGDFRNNHRHCHSIADMAKEVGGWITKEIAGGEWSSPLSGHGRLIDSYQVFSSSHMFCVQGVA